MSGLQGFRMVQRVVAVTAVFAAIALVPATGRAYDGPGCFDTWDEMFTGSGSCTLFFGGTPIDVGGEATAATAGGPAEIHVWLSPAGSPEVVLAECEQVSTGVASCGTQLTPVVTDARLPVAPGGSGISLQCNWVWKGNAPGNAGCFNSAPCPTIGDPSCISVLGEPLQVP